MVALTRIVLSLLVLGAAGGAAAYQQGVLAKPEYGVIDRGDWRTVTEKSISIESRAWVYNDNPISLNLSSMKARYYLSMNGVKLAEGSKSGLEIEKGNQTVTLTTELIQNRLPKWWVRHVRRGERSTAVISASLQNSVLGVPFKVDGLKYSTDIETNIESTMNQTVQETRGRYSGPSIAGITRPEIEVLDGSAEFSGVDRGSTELEVNLVVHNPNNYPIPAPGLDGELELNGVEIADYRQQPDQMGDARIDPGESQELKFTVDLDNDRMARWLETHVRADEKSSGSFTTRLLFEVSGISFTVPRDGLKCSFKVQTAILEDGQKPGSSFEGCETPEYSYGSGRDSKDSDGNTSGSLSTVETLEGLR